MSVVLGGNLLMAMTISVVAAPRPAVLLGGPARRETATASALAVLVTVPLAARSRLHYFVSDVISQEELTDALIFAAATRVVLPLMPDRYLGPYGAINRRIIWRIVILMMSINAGGYIAIQLLGPGFGLPIAGLASGFVSSTATRNDGSSRLTAACTGAVGGCRSRVVHDCDHSPDGRCPRRHPSIDAKPDALSSDRSRSGRARLRCVADGLQRMRGRATVRPKRKASSLKTTAFFASMIAVMLFLSAALNALLGKAGVSAGGRCGCGFADTHAAAVSVASPVAANQFTARSRVPILAGLRPTPSAT